MRNHFGRTQEQPDQAGGEYFGTYLDPDDPSPDSSDFDWPGVPSFNGSNYSNDFPQPPYRLRQEGQDWQQGTAGYMQEPVASDFSRWQETSHEAPYGDEESYYAPEYRAEKKPRRQLKGWQKTAMKAGIIVSGLVMLDNAVFDVTNWGTTSLLHITHRDARFIDYTTPLDPFHTPNQAWSGIRDAVKEIGHLIP